MNRYNDWKDKTPVRPFLKPTQTKGVGNPVLFWSAIATILVLTGALICILLGIAL